MHWAEVRRRREQDDVDPRLDHAPVTVKSDEPMLRINQDSRSDVLLGLHRSEPDFQPVFKRVGDRHEPSIRFRSQSLSRGATSTPPAADQTDADRAVTAGMCSLSNGQRASDYGRCRMFEKVTPS